MHRLHDWDLAVPEAGALQERLRSRVVAEDRLGAVRRVAGVDVSYDRGSPLLYAAVVVLDARTAEPLETAGVRAEARFPYVPGYLSFRELPAAIEAFEKLRRRPDLVLCDGQGQAHPRRFGLASHLGVWLDVPSIGCAKSVLVGTYREPGARRGCHTRLRADGETIGEAVRTRAGVKPVFVSVGHRVSLETARRWVLRLARGARLPETTRAAHREVNRLRAGGAA
jgi:deoxyribonuclease V